MTTGTEISLAQVPDPVPCPLKFLFRDTSGQLHKRTLSRAQYRRWSRSAAYPAYVQWSDRPFALLRSPVHGVGLFTDQSTTCTAGEVIGYAFVKTAHTGIFNRDYRETNIGSFVNDSEDPNLDVLLVPRGIIMRANRSIAPCTELRAAYRAIMALFPNDPTVTKQLRYW